MRVNLTYFLLISLICIGCAIFNENHRFHLSRDEELVNMTLAKTARLIHEKYKIKPCGSGAAMPGGPVRGLFLAFNAHNRYGQDK